MSTIAHLAMRLRRGLTLGVRAVIQDGGNNLLLVRHSYVPGWHFPGGGVEPGEAAISALAREVREEAAIDIEGEPGLFGVYLNRRLEARDHVLLYRVAQWRANGEFMPGLEIREARFFPLDALPAELSRGTRRRIGELFHGKVRLAEW